MVKGLYDCVGCGVQKAKFCKECNRKNKLIKFDLKVNDFVRLTKQAVKDFYGTGSLIDCYTVGGEMQADGFVKFVSQQLGFDNGNRAGVVTAVNEHNVKVKYFVPELGEWDSHYYGFSDLELVQEA